MRSCAHTLVCVCDGLLIRRLTWFVERLTTEDVDGALNETQHWTFIKSISRSNPELVNLSPLLDDAVLQLRKEVPLQLVVNMFQKMVSTWPDLSFEHDHEPASELAPCSILSSGKIDWPCDQDRYCVALDGPSSSYWSISRRNLDPLYHYPYLIQ